MARTLSDTIIIAMIEAASRLTGGRGPVSGASSSLLSSATQTLPAGGDAASAGVTPADGAGAATTPVPTSTVGSTEAGASAGAGGAAGQSAPRGEHDTRSAAQIASDFKTVYQAIEEVVKTSAEQETKSVGFSVR